MLLSRFLLGCFLGSFLLIGCTADQEPNGTSDLPQATVTVYDSIPLHNDSITYPYVNIDKLGKDSLLAFSFPSLHLYLLDSTGRIVQTINQKGNLKGQFRNVFIDPLWGPDGRLYVLEQGSGSRVTVFDHQLHYAYSAPALQDQDQYFLSLIQASSVARADPKGVQIVSSISNNVYSKYLRELYEEMSSIVSFFITGADVSAAQLALPYQDFSSVQQSLQQDQKNWDEPTAYFDYADGLYYVKYEFDDRVYVYDDTFTRQREIELHPAYPGRSYHSPLRKPEGATEQLASDFVLRYSRPYYYSIAVADNKIFTLYARPEAEEAIPRTIAEEQEFISFPVLHIYDLETGEEYSADLGYRFDPYAKVYPRENGDICLIGNTKLREDIYLYKCKLSY